MQPFPATLSRFFTSTTRLESITLVMSFTSHTSTLPNTGSQQPETVSLSQPHATLKDQLLSHHPPPHIGSMISRAMQRLCQILARLYPLIFHAQWLEVRLISNIDGTCSTRSHLIRTGHLGTATFSAYNIEVNGQAPKRSTPSPPCCKAAGPKSLSRAPRDYAPLANLPGSAS